MKTVFAIAVILSLSLSVSPKASVAAEIPRDIAADFAVRDAKTAAQKAEGFFTANASGWAKTAPPFRAESVIFTRSPVQCGATLKRGDPIWIVVVVNDAESTIFQVPLGIVWVRAKDGAIFVTQPEAANHSTDPTPASVTPAAEHPPRQP
jgi:hypothetical protein